MSNLFNYLNTSLTGAVVEGYEYSRATGLISTSITICYVIDKVDIMLYNDDKRIKVYIGVKIDPAYTTYSSIVSSNLVLTDVVYIPATHITEVKEFPQTSSLVEQSLGLVGANIKGYKYNNVTTLIDTSTTTAKVIDKAEIEIDNKLEEVYVCVLYTNHTHFQYLLPKNNI